MKNKLKAIMNKLLKKQALTLTCLVLTLSIVGGYSVFAIAEKLNGSNSADASKSDSSSESVKDQIDSIFENLNADKQETVYVIAKADGSVKKIIVSELLKNADAAKTIIDKSELKDVENVKNDNTYKMDGDSYVWDAEGDDIYYQGTIDKQLPVDMSINFKLDGKSVTTDELAGKSGKLEMTFNYKNNEYKTVSIDGKDEKIYVPFAMLSGLILDNDKCKNVEISNGKVISDGDRSIAIGFALPGMQDNLGISKDEFEIPDSVTITADVTDFELATTLTLASNDVFNGINLDNVKTYDELKDKLKTLDDSAKQLVDGSSSLYGYLTTLLNKSGDLVNGVQALVAGATGISNGADSLASGSTDLNTGVAQIYAGLSTLSQNSDELRGGAKQVFDTLLSTADTQIAAAGLKCDKLTVDNYSKVLNEQINNLDEAKIKAYATSVAKQTVTEEVKKNEETIKAGVTQAVKAQVLEGVLKTLNMTTEQYEAALKAGLISDAQKAQIESAVDQQMASDSIKATISAAVEQKENELIEQNMASEKVQTQINEAVAKAKSGKASLESLLTQLDSFKKFYDGINQYTAGVDTAAKGAKDLKDGSAKLNDGAKELSKYAKQLLSGVMELSNGSATLVDGVKQINGGAKTLSEGMQKFYDEGILKLTNSFNNDINPIYARLRATIDVSKEYESFAGKSDSMSGSTKFIYRTDSIEKK